MKYKSTRSSVTTDSLRAVLAGLAPDGGLYISEDLEKLNFDWQKCLSLNAQEKAAMILGALLPEYNNMEELVKRAYRNKFETEELTPLVKVGSSYVLELFRGPTSAFKDVALSMLPVLITAAKKQTEDKDEVVILTATSGDTGKAALEGFHNVEGTSIIVFYPDGGVSPIQKAQMVTQEGNNVCVCAVKGNFDDCQTAVKKAFREINLSGILKNSGKQLSSANSINIGRLAPQVTYYFTAYSNLIENKAIKPGDKVDYVVPTGNFGDILAGYFAKLLGLPVGKLICASNPNNVLTDFINTGLYDSNRLFFKTQSPSMDILVSSNLERLLYLASGNSSEKVSSWMKDLSETGKFKIDQNTLVNIQKTFESFTCSEEETTQEIRACFIDNHYLMDPHTAVAWHAAELYKKTKQTKDPVVVLSTASPYKFPKSVLAAIDPKSDITSEFEMMERINKLSGVKIPENLASLKNKKAIYSDVIDRDSIIPYVLEKLNIKK